MGTEFTELANESSVAGDLSLATKTCRDVPGLNNVGGLLVGGQRCNGFDRFVTLHGSPLRSLRHPVRPLLCPNRYQT